jgi:dihydropteroate synthase
MAGVAARFGAAVVLMHMKGTPATMQEAPHYADLIGEISGFLAERIRAAEAAGIPRERIVVDPGIGFGKSFEHNLELLRRQEAFLELGRPLLVGFSRKAFLGAILDLPPGERLEGTIAAAVISVAHGAHILRVHDVGPVSRAVRSAEAILGIAGDNGAACAGARAGAATAASIAANGKAGHVR